MRIRFKWAIRLSTQSVESALMVNGCVCIDLFLNPFWKDVSGGPMDAANGDWNLHAGFTLHFHRWPGMFEKSTLALDAYVRWESRVCMCILPMFLWCVLIRFHFMQKKRACLGGLNFSIRVTLLNQFAQFSMCNVKGISLVLLFDCMYTCNL